MDKDKLMLALKVKADKKAAIQKVFDDKAKVKPLTDKERLDRIEQILGIE